MSKLKTSKLLVCLLVIVALSAFLFQNPIVAQAANIEVNVSIYKGAGAGPEGAPGYAPEKIFVIIGVNNTIVWNNNDDFLHTATGFGETVDSPPPFDTDIIQVGQQSQPITIDKPGTYPYFCRFHQWMTGTVEILPEGSTITPPATTPTLSPTQPTVIATSPSPQTTVTPEQVTTPAPTTLVATPTEVPTPQPQTQPPTVIQVPATTTPAPATSGWELISTGVIAIIAVIIVVVVGVVVAVYKRRR